LILNCPFSDELDDYEPQYTAMLVAGDEAPDPDTIVEQLRTLQPVGTLDVSQVEFDSTVRKAARIPEVIGNVWIYPDDESPLI
jgi:hypothetical protein